MTCCSNGSIDRSESWGGHSQDGRNTRKGGDLMDTIPHQLTWYGK